MNEPAIEWIATRASGVLKPSIVTQWKKTGSVKRNASRPDQRWTRRDGTGRQRTKRRASPTSARRSAPGRRRARPRPSRATPCRDRGREHRLDDVRVRRADVAERHRPSLRRRRARDRQRLEAAARLVSSRARSSGDRARASGARGRRFDSCRAHHEKAPHIRGFRCFGGGTSGYFVATSWPERSENASSRCRAASALVSSRWW